MLGTNPIGLFKSSFPRLRQLFALLICGFLLSAPATHAQNRFPPKVEDFSESTLVISAAKYLGTTAESMAEIMDRVFSQYGIPDAIIRGEEVSAAVVFGLRYGRGTLEMRSGAQHPIYWRGPSAGVDTGGNAAKSFTLVYGVQNVEEVYSRFGGVDGSAFYLGGVAVNYLQRDDIVMAPMRAGVGLRAGVSIGYLKFTRESGWFPF
ncbi:MAG: EipA family protein [Parvibaculales bacterium]